jgi:hypothetical protein
MLDLIFWARLPLHLGFPSITKPLMSLKTTIEALQTKLDKVKERLDELSSREDFDIIVLKSYETELDIIATTLIQSRHNLLKASVDFAVTKLNESYQALLQDNETVNEIRLKKLTLVCRALLKHVTLQLKSGLDEAEEKWVQGLLEVIVNCVHEIYRHKHTEGLSPEELEWLSAEQRRCEWVRCTS